MFRGHSARITLGLVLSAALLFFAFQQVNVDELAQSLASASFKWIAVGLAFYWLELLLRVKRWSIILRPVRELAFSQVTTTLLIGYAANNTFPARLGELFRADFIGRRYGVSRLSAVGTIIVERLLDMAAVMASAGIGMLYMVHEHLAFPPLLYEAMRIGSILIAAACLTVFVMLFYATPKGLIARFPRMSKWVSAVTAGLQSVSRPREIASLTAISALLWLCNGAAMWAILMAVGITAQVPVLLLLIGMAGLAAAVPSAPANLGTLQFAFITVLAAAGFAATPSFAAALLVQVFFLGSVTVVGACLYAQWSLSRDMSRDDASA